MAFEDICFKLPMSHVLFLMFAKELSHVKVISRSGPVMVILVI